MYKERLVGASLDQFGRHEGGFPGKVPGFDWVMAPRLAG